MEDIIPALTHLAHSFALKTTLNIKPTWISYLPIVNELRNSEMIIMWDSYVVVKVGSGHVFYVLEVHVRVLPPINGCHSKANFA